MPHSVDPDANDEIDSTSCPTITIQRVSAWTVKTSSCSSWSSEIFGVLSISIHILTHLDETYEDIDSRGANLIRDGSDEGFSDKPVFGRPNPS